MLPDAGVGEEVLEPIPTSCAAASAGGSSVGCEFFAVDLDQIDDLMLFAVVVSNVQLGVDAEVVVEQKIDGAWETVGGPVDVTPLDQHIFELSDLHQQSSGILEGGAYRIRADVPVAAYQFNPLALGFGSASTDASLLLPVSSWDHLNQAVGWDPEAQGNDHAVYVTIAAAFDGTVVTITPAAPPDAGIGVPAVDADTPFEVELDAGDVVQVSFENAVASVTGTRIESDAEHPVAVFSGAECIFVMVYACDHLEEQLSGVRLWGLDFAAARVPVRSAGTPETSLWQIQASEDNTSVTLNADAAVTGLPASPVSLDAGETLEFYVGGTAAQPGDFIVHANKPVAVMNYMCGADNPPGSGTGDPAMVQLSPNEQFLPRYVVLVPNEWDTDVLVLTRLSGADIQLDGVVIEDSEFSDIDNGVFEVARIVVADGIHSLESNSGFSVVVVGYDSYDSYAYLGGSGTGKINPNPPG
jgi:hypothetical protein